MNSRILILISIIVLGIQYSSKSQIPGNDFETWSWTVMGSYDPVPWFVSNNEFAREVIQDSGIYAYHGNYSMLLLAYHSFAYEGFHLNQHPSYLTAHVMFHTVDSDTAVIRIMLYKNSILVDSGFWESTLPINNYTQLKIPISQNNSTIDSMGIRIMLNNGKTTGPVSNLWIDYLLLDSTTAGLNELQIEDKITVYPNPTSDKIKLKIKNKTFSANTVYLLNTLGDKEKEYPINKSSADQEIVMDLSDLPNGIYYIKFDDGIETKKIIKF